MSTELILDTKTARDLLKTVTRMKTKGVARVYTPGVPFSLGGVDHEASDSLVLTPSGDLTVMNSDFIDKFFEPVQKRTVTPKEK